MGSEEPSADLGSITFLTGPLAGKTFPITRSTVLIGRDTANDLVIKGDLKVSRHHARLIWQDGSWRIEKLSQTTLLTVNQQSVQQAIVQDGAVIGLGEDTSFRLVLQAAHAAHAAHKEADEETLPRRQMFAALADAGAALVTPTVQPMPAPLPPGASSVPPMSPADFTLPTAPAPAASVPAPGAADEAAQGSVDTQVNLPRGPTSLLPRASQTLVASAFMLGIPTLAVSSNTAERRRTYTLDKAVMSLGRDATADLVIDDPSVSGLHLQLVREGNQWVLVHPHPARSQTTNGLLFQGRKIRGDESFRKVLANGDVYRIGDAQGTLITLSFQDGSGSQPEALPPMQPIRLEAAELTIGRKPDNTVVLPHPQVSGHHARLLREGGAYRILDLHSTNHVYVNGQLVTNDLLKMGDEVRIGPYRLLYESTQLVPFDESNNIRIDALNLRKFGANQTTLLHDISLSIPPRAFVALVGGSGAGKTTLLDALSGLRLAQQGKVLYNGQDYYRNLAAFSTQIGYVPQDDIVHRELTVERALYYAAKIRLPADFTDEQIWQRIAEVVEDVELTERRKLLIKKLSGGQRKRVSIALELLANPSLFFLDEPTSGLDPGLDRKMMALLRKLADKGHTIILVTHATNNISVCDFVCFLAQGGRLAYYGPPEEAKAFFGKADFAEIYTALEATDENPAMPEEAEIRFKGSRGYQDLIAQPLKDASSAATGQVPLKEIKRVKRGGFWKQLKLLSLRRLELLRNDLPTLLVLLLQAPLVALLLMVLIRFELGPGILDGNSIVQCVPQIPTSLGDVGLPSPPPGAAPIERAVTCDRIVALLQTDPRGIAYANARGGVSQALQDFEVAGHNGDAQRIVFMLALIPILFGCITGAREIVKEVAIYRRERAVNLGILPYMLSKLLVYTLLALVQVASMVLIVNLFEPLPPGVILPSLLETYITLALAGIGGIMLGFTISALSPNEDTANSLLAVIIVPQVIFSGVVVSLKDPVSLVVAMIWPLRWGMAALGSSFGLHSDLVGGDKLFGNDYLYHGTLYSIYTQAEATQRIVLSWIAMGLIVLVLTGVIAFALKRKDARK
jgi:ABC-type multidrug transport system ATPase subunit/pSer/pThr/pTyr-binding forkhead associated (FHA) protein/ABC-type multidrug transport system permease subunit